MFMSRELLVCLLVLATLGFALHAARPPPSLGRVEATLTCESPVEIAGAGVVCLTSAEARAKKLNAGDRVTRARLTRAPPPSAPTATATTATARPTTPANATVTGATDPPARMAADRLAAWRAPVDVNRATVEELASLDGIGPKLAARIVAARPFAGVEDVARVKGIGVRRLTRLRERLVLDE